MYLLKDLYEIKDLGNQIPDLTTDLITSGGYNNWRKLVVKLEVKFSRTKGLNIVDSKERRVRDFV